MPDVLFISDQHTLEAFPDFKSVGRFETVPPGAVPSLEQVRSSTLVLVLGELQNPGRARQLASTLDLTMSEGTVVVVAFPAVPGQETAIIKQLAPTLNYGNRGDTFAVAAEHPAFREYLEVFGQSNIQFDESPGAEVLGRFKLNRNAIAAICCPIEAGALYVLSYFMGGAPGLLDALVDAVVAHRSGAVDQIPQFLEGQRVHGETELLSEIAEHEESLDRLNARAAELAGWRFLMSQRSGDAFEQLVIKALNVVLGDTAYSAIDREDVGAEDFWIVGPTDDFAFAEAKGVNRHVRREDVNQVDNHRSVLGKDVDELPGLLVMNIFRGDERLEQRELPVALDVARQAVRQNVLVLRSLDLYLLVSRKLAGHPAGEELIEALGLGGGWWNLANEAPELIKD